MAKAATPKENTRLSFFKNDLSKRPSLHKTFEKLYNDKKGDWPTIHKVLQKNKSFSAGMVKNLAFTQELASWTNDNITLVSHFQSNKETNSMRDIALTINKTDLKKLTTGAAIPKGEIKAAYVNKLYNELYTKEPTAVIVNMINDPKVPLWNNEIGNMISGVLSKIPEFNIKTTSVYEVINNKDVLKQIPKKEIEQVISQLKTLQRITLISPVPEAIPALINNNYISTYSITELPPAQFIATMLGTELPYETLEYIYAEAEKKKAFYEHVLITVKEAGEKTGIKIIDGDTPSKGEHNNTNKIDPDVQNILTKNNLSWDLLFGDADFCECGECTSVYSAAAYYVDLLQYLRNNNLEGGKIRTDPTDISNTPLEKLFARRPDLGHLELTCKNTNTILPYVDLVNEVMEQYIAFKLKSEDFKNYTGFNVADETSGELLSAPQHTEQEKAYQTLQTALFPFSLPYHQPIDAARIFLNHVNSSRHEMIDIFRVNNATINFNTAAHAEFLGLTEEEYAVLTKENFNGIAVLYQTYQYYGLANSGGLSVLSQVKKEFLPRTGIEYTELIELLKTQYLNPLAPKGINLSILNCIEDSYGNVIKDIKTNSLDNLFLKNPALVIYFEGYKKHTIEEVLRRFLSTAKCMILQSPNNNCSLDDVRLLHLDMSPVTANEYDKMQRFIRLWRKLGYTIDETDKIIMALGAGNITSALIQQLVSVKKIMSLTGIELTKLLCLWGNISTSGDNSLYKQLFLSHNLLAMDEVFKPVDGVYLNGAGTISQHLPAVMAALNLSADDIAAIKMHKSLPDDFPMTIQNLSLLFRYRLVSKILGLRVPAFVKLLPVFGDVFKDADTSLHFLENWTTIEEAGFTVEQLNYIITGTDTDKKPFAPSEQDVLVFTKKLYDGLNSIELEHADLIADKTATTVAEKEQSVKDKATTELVRNKASLLYDSSTVEQIISILNAPDIFKTTVPKNLDIDWPVQNILKDKVAYEISTGILTITGVLNQAETVAFNNLKSKSIPAIPAVGIIPEVLEVPAAPLPVGWSNGLTDVIALQTKQEEDMQKLFQLVLSGIFDQPDSVIDTYCKVGTSDAKRLAFIQVFLSFIRSELTNRLITEEVVKNTGLDKVLFKQLIENVLRTGSSSLNGVLASIKELNFQNVNDAYLIPATGDNFTFGTRDINITLKLNDTKIDFTGSAEINSAWWALEPVPLQAGNVYKLSVTLDQANPLSLKDVYWKTPLTQASSIPASQLIPQEAFNICSTALKTLKKATLLVNTFKLSINEITFLHNNHNFDSLNSNNLLQTAIDFNGLKLISFLRIANYCNLRNSLPPTKTNILDFWKWIYDTTTPETDLNRKIAELSLWKLEDVEKLVSSGHFNLSKNDFKNEQNLLKLQRALAIASKIGMDINKLFEWAIPTSDFIKCKPIADSIQKAIRAQYNQTDWEQVVKPLNDQLRNNQKNALISYLLQKNELKTAGVTDADGLFEYFLIDVQMDPCMETSRIKQAISSVQLFIQRCFLGLEKNSGITSEIPDRKRWEWMERFRVWEANRKVFLYPENWIESNLRDDKSPFFKELESELLQKDINKQNVTDALKTYLYKVDEVANMEVVGLFIEGKKADGTNWEKGSKLHVFSRTRNAPYFFYYRYLALDEMNWYPWEKMQLDIPSYDVEDSNGQITGNGCYLTPVVWNKRLLVFFPQFMKKTKPSSNSNTQIKTITDSTPYEMRPIEYREVKMAFSEYKNGKWTQKQQSKGSLYDDTNQISSIAGYNFYPEFLTDSIQISIYGNAGQGYCIGGFNFDGSHLDSKLLTLPNLNYSGAYFQHFYGIYSYQKHPESSHFLFDDGFKTTFHWVPNQSTGLWENYLFYLSHIAELIGTDSSNKIAELFEYNLSIPETEKVDVFGKSLQLGYHELKRPYSIYNWELFFHTPVMLANALSKAQQFEEAMKWFHYVFNPMADGSDDKRFWQFAPFKEINSKSILEQIFNNLKGNKPGDAINEWRNNPFNPHLVARNRPVAYMKWVVMKYIDNILDWGDYLFRQDTIESINQATQLYVIAGHILGPKPMLIPQRGEVKKQTYISLLDKWDAFSNAMSELEVATIYNIQPAINTGTKVEPTVTADIFGSASALYFCLPKNPKLLGYWDTLADRLFKIRHCQNIEGVFRMLPLFEPPIDPALLIKAAAQGLSIASVVNDLNSAMPNYRFYYLLQKALELCNELKSLGGAMLSAIEKKDNETISLIRARHEGTMNNLVMEIKKLQLEEAQKTIDSLYQNRKAPEAKMRYYMQLIGEKDQSKIPAIDVDFSELVNSIETPIDESGLRLSKFEKEEYDKSIAAHSWQLGASVVEALSAIFHAIPNAKVHASPLGVGGSVGYGGTNLGNSSNATAKVIQIISSQLSFEASNAAKKGGFQRALQERIFQANAAGYELKQIDKQITTQLIRINIANQEISNQLKQIDNSNEVEEFLKNKYTNEELYVWMRGSLKTLYHQVYNLAYDLAKKAERTYCFERGITNAGFIQSGYFDAGREGLLAGEQLYVGLKQLESAYQEKRGYDYEITKHVSLRQLDPFALLKLKAANKCEFDLPEVLFDMDYPGHFKRRIKSVSVSVPCIAGPYTGVNASLRLVNNKFRNSSIANNYPEKTDEQDDRFISYNIPITAIATSSAQNDSGMFELNFKDERYLPFEGAGVISRWSLELPGVKQFDYYTISDVVLHIKYIASEGGEQLKESAKGSVYVQVNQINQQLNETGLHIPWSMKHDMPNEWNLFIKNGITNIIIEPSRLPYMAPVTTNAKLSLLLISRKKILRLRSDINPGIDINFNPIPGVDLFKSDEIIISIGSFFKLYGYKNGIIPSSVVTNNEVDNTDLLSLDDLVIVVKFILTSQ